MERHIKVARAHRAISWLYGVLTLVFLPVLLFSEKSPPLEVFLIVIIFFGGFFALHHFTAKGAFNKRNWARRASQGIALLMLLGIPIGTLIGIYLLTNSWSDWRGE